MHIGPYDDEPRSVAVLKVYCNGFREMSGMRNINIYLGDPRKTAPEKLKTVIRHPIVKI